MPALQQNPDDMAVAGNIKEVLRQRIGSDRFGLWFGERVEFRFDGQRLSIVVDGDFARERLRRHYFRAIESAAAESLGRLVTVSLVLPSEVDGMLTSEAEPIDLQGPIADNDPVSETLPDDVGFSDAPPADRPMMSIGSRLSVGSSPGGRPLPPQLQRRAGRDGGPAPFHQFALASATEPRHSQRNSPHSQQATPYSMQPNFDRNDSPAAVTASRENHRKQPLRSLRVLSDPAVSVFAGDQPGHSPQSVQATQAAHSQQPSRLPQPTAVMGDRASAARPLRVPSPSAVPSGGDAAGRRGGGASSDQGSGTSTAGHAMSRRNDVMTFTHFVSGTSNTLAITAAKLLANEPLGSAPLCFWGATGTGKTHLLSAIRHELRTRHRLGRVLLMSAEEFTNDFLSCVRGTGLPAFRKRYRDVDAMLIDNVQFLGGKNATVREMMYTIDTVLSRRRPLVMAADRPPLEIPGLPGDLAGRMSSGLVCGINPMDLALRRDLLRTQAQHSYLPWDEETIELLAQRISGDGRAVQGIVQMVSMLQRMYRRMPTIDEIVAQAGELLQRGPKVVALADVEKAICTAFGLTSNELRSESKSRNVSQPRILAMYLSRQHTTAAFSEIGRYYGDRNHSTVIAAHRRVEDWIKRGQVVGGRGPKNLKVQDAIAAVENLLRIG